MKIGLLLAAAVLLPAQSVNVSRASFAAVEKNFDQRLQRASVDDPLALTVNTRGVYLNGYGAVFTSEVNLVASAVISPFRPQFTREELTRLKQKKQQRVGVLKQTMREMLLASASALDSVPPGEQMVLDVAIFYFQWEDAAGLPREIMMQAPRRALLDAARGNPKGLEGVLKVQEF